jgi:hypothetical protein
MNSALVNIYTGTSAVSANTSETIYSNESFEQEVDNFTKTKRDCWETSAIKRLEFYRDI